MNESLIDALEIIGEAGTGELYNKVMDIYDSRVKVYLTYLRNTANALENLGGNKASAYRGREEEYFKDLQETLNNLKAHLTCIRHVIDEWSIVEPIFRENFLNNE